MRPESKLGSTKLDITVRPLQENDLDAADHIMRLAFGTFIGLPEPTAFMGDADYVYTRSRANPAAAFGATVFQDFGPPPIARGFVTQIQGVIMSRPNEAGYNRPGVYLIDDWR